jgi:hypothetical protein
MLDVRRGNRLPRQDIIAAASGRDARPRIAIAGRNHIVNVISYGLVVGRCRSIGREIKTIRVRPRDVEVLERSYSLLPCR